MNDTIQLPQTKGEEKLRKVWRQMKDRCANPKNIKYARYGGRGIQVCAEWMDYQVFRSWAISAGYAEGRSVDRIDNDGNYEPDNCRFSNPKGQANNTSTNLLIQAFGETKSVALWADDPRCVVSYAALYQRIVLRSWPVEKSLITPEIKNNGKATHCPQGHEYTLDNICWDGPNKTWRKCATCNRLRARRNYHEKVKRA